MKWLFFCCVGLFLLCATSRAEAAPGSLELASIGQLSFGSLLENKSYLSGKKGKLLLSPALGVLRQASTFDLGFVLFAVVLPSVLGGSIVLAGLIGAIIALARERGRFAWGIYNVILAGCLLVSGVTMVALGLGLISWILTLVGVFHAAIGIPTLYLGVKARRLRGVGFRGTPEDSPSMASFRLQSITPAGVTFSF